MKLDFSISEIRITPETQGEAELLELWDLDKDPQISMVHCDLFDKVRFRVGFDLEKAMKRRKEIYESIR